MKNIFLGALPIDQTLADTGNDEIFVNNDPVKSNFTPYPLETFDKPIQLDEPVNSGTGTGTDEGKGTGTGSGAGTGTFEGEGEGEGDVDAKKTLSPVVIIGAAALIYFFFLRKK